LIEWRVRKDVRLRAVWRRPCRRRKNPDMELTQLKRAVEAIQIPGGHVVTLEEGWDVVITQSLGGAFTVQVPAYGGLFRIAGPDADALGKEPVAATPASASAGGDLEQQVWDVLRTCYDPEIPVNIVDLGLVYDMRIAPADDGNRVDVKMTLTAPGCGMGTSIAADARMRLLSLPGVTDADVQVVWDPPWSPQMISPEGRQRLGMD
jgi:probable FeS assembly SUF system protein SufT